MEQDYKKSWNTLKAESGGRWCQPHPLSNELLTIGELMRNMERRASETAELAATTANTERDAIAAFEQWAHLFEVRHPDRGPITFGERERFLDGYRAATAPVS